MSWGRGVNNNAAGHIRAPAVPEHAVAKRAREADTAEAARLVVRRAERHLPTELSAVTNFAFVGETSTVATPLLERLRDEGRCYIYAHGHPHFILRLATRPGLPEDAIVLSEVQRCNSHVCDDEPYEWRVFSDWRLERPLKDLVLEVRPRFPPPDPPLTMEASRLVQACAKALFGLIVTVEELFLVETDGVQIVARLVEVGIDDLENEGGGECGGDAVQEGERDDLTLPDHYRGMVDPETRVFLRIDDVANDTLVLQGLVVKAEVPPARDVVDVTTGDGEYFPVKKKLLRPCIALTSAVMAGSGVHGDARPAASVATDCCTFDRVLLFLEASARGRPYDVAPEHLEDLAAAAETLKLGGLQDLCAAKRGAFESRVRREPIPFQEIVERNARGEVILTMDGMVLDVTRWLEEHPGGSTIIPEQALNMDSTVFFEIYHVSRQSFLYLKEFYIGELREEDLPAVPRGAGEPSPGFLEQLRSHTTWRVRFDADHLAAHKSF